MNNLELICVLKYGEFDFTRSRYGGFQFKSYTHLITKGSSEVLAKYAAYNLRRKRFIEAEHIIIKEPWWASQYAMHVMKCRWPEAEDIISRNSNAYQKYKEHFNIQI